MSGSRRLAVGVVALLASGCVHRSLTIRTDPPGAMVYLNDELKGQSPVSFDFLWYGTHRVIVKMDGYERVEDRKTIRTPIYLWIPLDFVAELLPLPIHQDYTWDYTLAPAAMPSAPAPPDAPPTPKEATPHDPAG